MKLAAIKPISRVLVRELAVTALLLLGVSVVVLEILYDEHCDQFILFVV